MNSLSSNEFSLVYSRSASVKRKDPRMKQLWLQFLLAVFIAGAWLSLEEVQCQNTPKDHPIEIHSVSYCYNKSSGKTCFTLLINNSNRTVRRSFKAAEDLCKAYVPGSSLIIIRSLADQRSVEGFIGRQSFTNETIFTDARKLSAKKRLDWSWVNGHQTIPTEVNRSGDTACVVLEDGKRLAYCVSNFTSEYHYICEYSGSKRVFSYQQSNKYYIASSSTATWYDARSECLRLGGDLASLTDQRNITETSWLRQNYKYWIGLHKIQWIWNSTGAPITYTNWGNGYPDDSDDKQCICLNLKCSTINSVAICDERKWWSCDCKNNSNAVVCQSEEAKETADRTEMLPSTSADLKSSITFPVHTGAPSHRSSSSSPDRERYVTWLGISLAISTALFSVAMTYIIFTKIRKRKKRTVQTKSPLHPVRDELQSSTDGYEMLAPGEQAGNKTYTELQLYETVEDDTKQDLR